MAWALPIENSREWALIADAAKRRIDELRIECSNLSATHEQRYAAAVRIDEIEQMLSAPVKASRRVAMANGESMGTY